MTPRTVLLGLDESELGSYAGDTNPLQLAAGPTGGIVLSSCPERFCFSTTFISEVGRRDGGGGSAVLGHLLLALESGAREELDCQEEKESQAPSEPLCAFPGQNINLCL